MIKMSRWKSVICSRICHPISSNSPGKDLWKTNDFWSLELKEMCLSEIYMKVIWLIAILLYCTRILLIYRAFFFLPCHQSTGSFSFFCPKKKQLANKNKTQNTLDALEHTLIQKTHAACVFEVYFVANNDDVNACSV